MTAKRLAFLILLPLFVFCAACVPVGTQTGGSTTTGSGPERILAQAEKAYNQGQYRAAADAYKRYLQSEQNPPRLESVLAVYGLSAEKAGQFNDAISAYERLAGEFPTGEFTAEAKPRLADVYLASGDAAKSESLANQFLSAENDPDRQARLRLTIAQSQWVQGRYSDAASGFLTVWRGAANTPARKSAAEEGVLASLTKLDKASLEQVQRQYGQNFPGPQATYLLVRKAAEAGDAAQATSQAEYFERYFSSNPLMPQVTALVQSVGAPASSFPPPAFGVNYDPRQKLTAAMADQAAPATMGNIGPIGDVSIAVILPLSNNNASKFAQEVLAGLKLAINSYPSAQSIGLLTLDTRGSAEEAARLVSQAASDPKIMAIVGPFLSSESAQAAQTANRAGLPLIAISQRTDLTSIGPNVFRIFLTPKHQTEAVARYAVRSQNHQTLGIIYPDDNYGRPIRTYFENEAKRMGGQVTVAESYDPQAVDWDEVASRITGSKAARRVSTNYQAQTDFTVLFLPDSAAIVTQIIPMMAYHDVTKMQYLGSSLWLNKNLLSSKATANYIQGAVIPVAISDLSQREESRRFITAYQNANGRAPDQFAAYGYDAGLALIKAFGQGAVSRDAVRRSLSQGGLVPGATGPFSFDRTGEYVVEPTLITIQGQEFILLRDAASGAR